MVKKSAENGSDSVAPFLKKCYEMVDDEATDSIISWSQTGGSFVIWDTTELSVQLLPKYFKHSNFSSFMRQLNIYGFRKIDADRWEFANDGFVRGQEHLLKNICRRKKSQQPENSDEPGEKIENLDLWKEIENLKTDKNALTQELVNLRQHQEISDNKLLLLRDRLQGMEKNQQQILSFLVMAMQNPGFLVQLLQPKENNWRMAKAANILEVGTEDDRPLASDGMIIRYQPPVDETPEPVQIRTPGSEKKQEINPPPDGMKDFFLNADFLKMLMDEKMCSLDNHAPFILPDLPDDGSWEQLLMDEKKCSLDNHASFILPDLPDDGSWEQLLLATPFIKNTEDRKMDSEEPIDSGMEMESTESGSQCETSENFELLIKEMEKSSKLGM
ncbi:heat stress transcription factor A-8 [Corylus avellana]|uniref:heat stress transcription factor A-8 n=1 Tax=Corylus avellana TaxID=13451 RepID=UPI00286C63FF|nr:heat stress transcription factor A-8 [Corylus avellana]